MWNLTPKKKNQLTNAVGFLCGVLACLDALRDSKVFWPPDALWQGLRNAQRVELAGGIALIVVTLVIAAMPKRAE